MKWTCLPLSPPLNPVVPVVANSILVAEIEKLHVKLDAVSLDIARISNIMQEVGKAEPVTPEPVAPVPAPVDNLAQILDEMRFQQREMRKYIGLWALFVMFVVILFITILDMVHAPAPAASPACCPECPVVNDWVVAKCFADEFVKNARDEWVRFTKK